MFLAHPLRTAPIPIKSVAEAEAAVWLDLVDPTEQEQKLAGEITGLRVPSRADLDEIESSSRLYKQDEALYLSMPLIRRIDGQAISAPLGFVLTRDRLITVRYTDYPVFEIFAKRITEGLDLHTSGSIMLGLLEAITDRLADVLEHAGGDLDELSKRVFHADRRRQKHADRILRHTLRSIGRHGDLVSMVRDSLLGLQRIANYLTDNLPENCPEALRQRLATIGKDIGSLNDYDAQLTNKVQFLLDATLGFINIEQNVGIRLLTVVSIIGVPPTLVASIYGMNFKNIPELNWNYGYFYALGLMAVTVAGPLLVFWRKGWLSGH